MPDDVGEMTPEQKLLHAIFAPVPEDDWKTYMTDDVLERIREKIHASAPYQSRMEACGEIRISFDKLWEILTWHVRYQDVQDDDEDVAVDLAIIHIANICRMLIDLDYSFAVPESSKFSGDSA